MEKNKKEKNREEKKTNEGNGRKEKGSVEERRKIVIQRQRPRDRRIKVKAETGRQSYK